MTTLMIIGAITLFSLIGSLWLNSTCFHGKLNYHNTGSGWNIRCLHCGEDMSQYK